MRHMIGMLLTIHQINGAINANRFIYYLKRLPLIGRKIPDRIYGDSDLKMTASVVATILRIIKKLAGKALYIGLMLVLPLMLLFKGIPKSEYAEAFVHMFFFLSFLAGSVQISVLLESDRHKYICIKLMRFPAKDFVVPSCFAAHLSNLIYFMPTAVVAYAILRGNLLESVTLLLLMTAFRFIFEAVQLYLYAKWSFLLHRKYVWQWAVIIPFCAAAYLPLYHGIIWPVSRVLFSLPVVAIIAACAFLSILYIIRFQEYKRAVEAVLKLDDIMVDIEQLKKDATFGSVRMKEGEFSKESLKARKYEKKSGYEYLNAIFFERHRKLLEKPILIRLCIIAVILAAGIAVIVIFPELRAGLDGSLLGIMPLFVFIMYTISLGDRICKAMFYNCDISLLRYSFYRRRDAILGNFVVRLKKITALNLIVGIALCAAMLLFGAASGMTLHVTDMLLFTVSILCLAVFFSVHHLFLYYVFQPYTTELGVKNPFFKLINTIVYLICFGCLQLKTAPGYFTIAVIAATVIYIVTALILVYRLAPRNFRVK